MAGATPPSCAHTLLSQYIALFGVYCLQGAAIHLTLVDIPKQTARGTACYVVSSTGQWYCGTISQAEQISIQGMIGLAWMNECVLILLDLLLNSHITCVASSELLHSTTIILPWELF